VSRRPASLSARLVGIAAIVAVGALVEGLLLADVISVYVMPLPTQILQALGRVVMEEHVAARFLLTSFETAAAAALILLVGVPLAFLLYASAVQRAAFEPWVVAWAGAPLVLAYPLFLVLFGRSPLTPIVMGFASGVAPVVLKTLEGLDGIRPVLIGVGRSLQLDRRQIFWKILLPASLPAIFTGMRLGLTFCLINVVAVEFLINLGGLGQFINEMAERYDLPGTWAAIGFVVLASMVFFILAERAEQWLQRSR
jgi:NitT/TauT family transport system permease protein